MEKRTKEHNEEFIKNILNLIYLEKVERYSYIYIICENYLLHYKKPFQYLIDFINSYNVNNVFNIKDSDYYNLMSEVSIKKIDNYLNSLCRCGYISRISKKEKKYLILSKIPEDLKTTKISNKDSVKKIQRINKLNKIL